VQGVQILLLLAGSLAVTAIARRLDWPAPLLLVAVGLAVSFAPGMPVFRLEPELVLVIVLPPLRDPPAGDGGLARGGPAAGIVGVRADRLAAALRAGGQAARPGRCSAPRCWCCWRRW